MYKHESRVDISDHNLIKELVNNSYSLVDGDTSGRNISSDKYLTISKTHPDYESFMDMNSTVVKLKSELINGNMRVFIKRKNDDILLYVIDENFFIEAEKYNFF